LREALARARQWGFLGEGSLDVHVAHAGGFAAAAESAEARRAPTDSPRWMDLGSGGGIPGLVLARAWPDREGVLLEANRRRGEFLRAAVDDLGWAERVSVVIERAETAGRDPNLRGGFSLVVARSFGPPAVTAECAAPFLRVSGLLVVSEPPGASGPQDGGSERWPEDGLADVGLIPAGRWQHEFGYQLMRQVEPCPPRFPRRVGVARKRPLY